MVLDPAPPRGRLSTSVAVALVLTWCALVPVYVLFTTDPEREAWEARYVDAPANVTVASLRPAPCCDVVNCSSCEAAVCQMCVVLCGTCYEPTYVLEWAAPGGNLTQARRCGRDDLACAEAFVGGLQPGQVVDGHLDNGQWSRGSKPPYVAKGFLAMLVLIPVASGMFVLLMSFMLCSRAPGRPHQAHASPV